MAGFFIRRSLLVVSPKDRAAVDDAWASNADAIVLDLSALSVKERVDIRPLVQDDILRLGRAGAEVLVRMGLATAQADIAAAVWPGLTGIILSYPETVGEVKEAVSVLDAVELENGVEAGTVEIGVVLGTPKAIRDIRPIITASLRVSMVGLDEAHLASAMGLVVRPDLDPFKHFARGRFVTEAASTDRETFGQYGIHRLGLGFPLSCLPLEDAVEDEVYRAAKWAKDLGMNGAICPYPSWVDIFNRAFTPTDEEINEHRRLMEAYAAGVAEGRGAVPLGGGRFVERPQVELAKAVIALREQCDRRDADKAAARAAAGGRNGSEEDPRGQRN